MAGPGIPCAEYGVAEVLRRRIPCLSSDQVAVTERSSSGRARNVAETVATGVAEKFSVGMLFLDRRCQRESRTGAYIPEVVSNDVLLWALSPLFELGHCCLARGNVLCLDFRLKRSDPCPDPSSAPNNSP